MSTSLLYHAWGIRGYKYLTTRYERGQIVFVIEPNRNQMFCPECKESDWCYHGGRWRTIQTLPIGARRVFLEVKIPRLFCYNCGASPEVDPPFADPYCTYSHALEQYVVELCRITTIKGAARLCGLSWHTVKRIDKRYLQKEYAKVPIKDVRYIAIDEFAVRKGHRYMTDVINLETGRIIYVADGRDGAAIIPFLKRLKRRRSQSLDGIAIDMSVAYTSAVRNTLPGVPFVYDRFHVMQKMSERLDELRRRLMRDMEEEQRKFVKGVRFLLLMGKEKLDGVEDEKPGSKQRLEEALTANQPLSTGYYLKEKLRILWDQRSWDRGQKFLDDWCLEANSSEIPELRKMTATLFEHRDGILNYFHHPISTGPLEGIHNKIKTLKREAYGFRDDEYFKLRLLALHESHYALLRF